MFDLVALGNGKKCVPCEQVKVCSRYISYIYAYNGIKMSFCCVPGCSNSYTNTADQNVAFYSIPKKPKTRRKIFVDNIGRDWKWLPSRSTRICSVHFIGNHKSEDPKSKSYVPTQKLPKKIPEIEKDLPIVGKRKSALRNTTVCP